MPEKEQQYRIVTAAQLTEGRLKKIGQFIYERRYEVVKKLPDGNCVVVEEKPNQEQQATSEPIPSI